MQHAFRMQSSKRETIKFLAGKVTHLTIATLDVKYLSCPVFAHKLLMLDPE